MYKTSKYTCSGKVRLRLLAINHPTRPPTPPRSHFRDHFDHMYLFYLFIYLLQFNDTYNLLLTYILTLIDNNTKE